MISTAPSSRRRSVTAPYAYSTRKPTGWDREASGPSAGSAALWQAGAARLGLLARCPAPGAMYKRRGKEGGAIALPNHQKDQTTKRRGRETGRERERASVRPSRPRFSWRCKRHAGPHTHARAASTPSPGSSCSPPFLSLLCRPPLARPPRCSWRTPAAARASTGRGTPSNCARGHSLEARGECVWWWVVMRSGEQSRAAKCRRRREGGEESRGEQRRGGRQPTPSIIVAARRAPSRSAPTHRTDRPHEPTFEREEGEQHALHPHLLVARRIEAQTLGPGRARLRASCVVRRASCVVRRASCVVRRASCVVRHTRGVREYAVEHVYRGSARGETHHPHARH
jgi:hypothetical protein